MHKLIAVLLALSSVVVCDCFIIEDYEQPVATSYVTREDSPGGGKNFGYGYSKKYGYNKMVVTSYLTPVPEEVAASYSTYIIHPVDKERCGYNAIEGNPTPTDDTKMPGFFQMFPIVVEDEKIEEPNEESSNEYRVVPLNDDKMVDGGNQKVFRGWFVKNEPEIETVIDDKVKEWFKQGEPKISTEEYWKNFKKQFDALYEDEFKKLFGDDHDDDDYDDKEDYYEDEGANDDWYHKTPYQYNYEYQNENDKWNDNDFSGPKYDFGEHYENNDDHYGNGW